MEVVRSVKLKLNCNLQGVIIVGMQWVNLLEVFEVKKQRLQWKICLEKLVSADFYVLLT